MTERDGSGGEKSVLLRGLELLELILERSGSGSMRELAAALHAQPSTVHRTLTILEQSGYLFHDASGQMMAGPNLLRLAALIFEHTDPAGAVHEQLARVVRETNETAVLYLTRYPDCAEVFVADVVTSSEPLQYRVALGHSHAITAGASGLSVLAFLPDPIRDAVLSQPLRRYTQKTIQDVEALSHRLEEIRRIGYAVTHGEHISGAVGLAVPVFDRSGSVTQVIGDVCLTVPVGRFDSSRKERYLKALQGATDSLSVHFSTMRRYGHQLLAADAKLVHVGTKERYRQ